LHLWGEREFLEGEQMRVQTFNPPAGQEVKKRYEGALIVWQDVRSCGVSSGGSRGGRG